MPWSCAQSCSEPMLVHEHMPSKMHEYTPNDADGCCCFMFALNRQLGHLEYCSFDSLKAFLVLPFPAMEDAKLSVQHCITIDSTQKSWKIPGNFMKTGDDGTQWLQIRASSFGLCNVMTKDKLDAKARPTFRESMGYKKLIEKRNEMVFGAGSSGDALFGDAPPKKKLKAKEKIPADDSLGIHLDEEGAVLQIKSCSKSSDDLVIAYNSDNVNLFFYYMNQAGVKLATEGDGKRSYKKTGKYSKASQAEQEAGSASEKED